MSSSELMSISEEEGFLRKLGGKRGTEGTIRKPYRGDLLGGR